MKRITVLIMLCCTLFCVCAIASGIGRERKPLFITSLPVVDRTPPASSSVAVSGEVIIHLDTPTTAENQDSDGKGKSVQGNKEQTVTDITGRKRKLKLGDVDINKKEVEIQTFLRFPRYSQVADGHYYYLRKEGKNRYTLYCDKGERVGSFSMEKGYYFWGCCKYGSRFYVLLYRCDIYIVGTTISDRSSALAVVDFSRGQLRILREMESLSEDELYFYQDKIRSYHSADEEDFEEDEDEYVKGKEFSGESDILGDGEEIEGYEYRHYIMDGNRYYTKMGKEGDGHIIRQNMKTKKKEEIFRYQTKRKKPFDAEGGIDLDIDRKSVFIEEWWADGEGGNQGLLYVVPRSGGKMKLVTDGLAGNGYIYNSRYIFWQDDHDRIHRWNRKTQKEEKMIETSFDRDLDSWELSCTEEGLYIQERGFEDADRPGYNLYYMGFNGENLTTVWDDKKYIDDAWPNH